MVIFEGERFASRKMNVLRHMKNTIDEIKQKIRDELEVLRDDDEIGIDEAERIIWVQIERLRELDEAESKK